MTEHSAVFGQGFLVMIEYTTEADGEPVAEDCDPPNTLHGPFDTEAEAVQWMETYPDFDELDDMTVVTFNRVR